jgi:hypothetical protein
MQILNLAAVTLLLLVLIFLRELFLWHRVRRLSRLARGLLVAAVVAPPLGAMLVLDFMPGGGPVLTTLVTTMHVIQGLLLHISTLLPANLLAVTAAALVPVVLMYLLLERLFAKTELLGPVRVPNWWSAEG